jgi:hypothetical protein
MIPEIIIALIVIIILIKLLYPDLSVPVPPTGIISGGLTYNGAPVVDATVTLYSADLMTEIEVVTSGADGRFTLKAEANGQYHLTAILQNADGSWLQGDRDILIDSPTVNADLTLESTT